MAQLWAATNEATGAEVCVKILVPEQSDTDSVERFRREAYAAARLSHRAIVRIFDLFELGADSEATTGTPAALVIVMELLHGETLGDILMKRGKLPVDEAIDLAVPLISALAHAHRAGVVHRDLKPDNIFLATDPDGHVTPKILDFGVSKMASVGDMPARSSDAKPLTLDGVLLGTPAFMSPEQARGERDIDAASDVFSAGTLFYMMLAGQNPFESESFHAVVRAIIARDPPRLPQLDDAMWAVLEKALAKDVAQRYADATELGIAFRRASGRTSTTDSGPQLSPAQPPSARKLVPPLGGDSYVSVPPVGNAELGDTANEGADAKARAATPAARRRAVRIVVGVVGASVALLVVALLRGPDVSSATSSASATGAPPAPATGSAATATASATATATAAPVASAVEPAAGADAGLVPPQASALPAASAAPTAAKSSLLAAPRAGAATKTTVLPAPRTAPIGTIKEPSIVRDPGF